MPVIVGIVGGAFLSGRLAGRIPGDRQIGFGFAATIGGVAISVALHLADGVAADPDRSRCSSRSAAGGVQLVIPVLVLRMLDLFPEVRGSAASVQTCVMLTAGAFVMGAVVPAINGSHALDLVGALTVSVLSWVLWRFARRSHGPW